MSRRRDKWVGKKKGLLYLCVVGWVGRGAVSYPAVFRFMRPYETEPRESNSRQLELLYVEEGADI